MPSIPVQYRTPARRQETWRTPLARGAAVSQPPSDALAVSPKPGMPFLIFCVYTFILMGRPQDYIPALAPLRLGLVFTALTSLVTIFRSGEEGAGSPFRLRETKLYFFFFLVTVVTIPFSVYRRGSFEFVILSYSANVVFYFLFLAHVNTLDKFKKVVFILVLSSLTFTLAGLVKGEFRDGRYYTGSEMFDPNDTAFMEVSFLCFGLCVLLGSYRKLPKALASVSVLASVVLALYTGSRGGLLGLATTILAFMLLRIPKVKKSHKVTMVVVVGLVLAASFSKLNVEKYLTLSDLDSDYNASDEFGRSQIWVRGVQLFLQDPLTGVGVREFSKAIGEMRQKEGKVIPEWQAPHNSYIEVLTETGLFGALAFLSLILTCLGTFNALRRSPGSLGESPPSPIPGILLIGFMAELIGAMFLSQAYSMSFTLFFAASASLKQVAERSRTAGSSRQSPRLNG